MKIIILGAGQVGGTLAEQMADEAFDITLVDIDEPRLKKLRERLDIQTVQGMASHPDVLRQAGADDAEMLIAVTSSDEVNMVACQVCYSMFRTPTKIARVRAAAYHGREGFFSREHMPIDVLINPEEMVTDQIEALLEFPGALQVLDFADGRLQLVAVRAVHGGPLVHQGLEVLPQHVPGVSARVVAIFRRGRAILPSGDAVIEDGDEVFFIAARKHIAAIIAELGRSETAYKRIVIAGGGNIGSRLARNIERRYSLKLIERDERRSERLSEQLDHTVVLTGDATDEELLLDENIEQTDVFCALTSDDEANIMSSMLAKQLGAGQVMTLIGKPAYVDLVQGSQIDIAISPQQATISTLLTHVRRGDVVRAHRLRHGAAEAIEAIAHGVATSSKVVGRRAKDLDLPKGTTIGAVVRGEEVYLTDDVVIESDDHVVLFVTDKAHVGKVERLFQVAATFL